MNLIYGVSLAEGQIVDDTRDTKEQDAHHPPNIAAANGVRNARLLHCPRVDEVGHEACHETQITVANTVVA